jgi:exocyst complex component 1
VIDERSSFQALARAFVSLSAQLEREQLFIIDFLHTYPPTEVIMTFADYMDLETYFKRVASQHMEAARNRFKDVKTAMDMVFAFLSVELNEWIEGEVRRDPM